MFAALPFSSKSWLLLSRPSAIDRAVAITFALACLGYAIAFYLSVSPYWFHPDWTTDDAMQQLYPFHKVHQPELFRGDLITTMMESYLAPLHYWISWITTWVAGDPVMMGHWVMLFQILAAAGFLFGAVKRWAGLAPAFFAVIWLLHTRHVMQRMTAGVPRGWAPAVLLAVLYFIARGNHWAVLFTLAVGCILHTPSTLIAALCYGFYLLYLTIRPSTRPAYWPHLRRLVLFSPVCILLAVSVVRMPEEIGTMASYERAASMPEFQRPSGRFPFVPLKPAEEEIRQFGFQAFVGRFYKPRPFFRRNMAEIVVGCLALIAAVGAYRKRMVIPPPVWCFGAAALTVYFASRILAFKLYVPDRHLQIPLAIFFIIAFSVGAWRVAAEALSHRVLSRLAPAAALVAVGVLVYIGSSHGLKGAMNFNWQRYKRGAVWDWIRDETPRDALIAGHPTWIDPVMLYGERQGFVTTETAHPFYDNYYAEMKRRTEIAFRIHYAPDFATLVAEAEKEGIDFVVFQRSTFRPEALAQASYFPPFRELVRSLAEQPNHAFHSLPKKVDEDSFPPLRYVDDLSMVVDVARLKEFLANPRPAISQPH